MIINYKYSENQLSIQTFSTTKGMSATPLGLAENLQYNLQAST